MKAQCQWGSFWSRLHLGSMVSFLVFSAVVKNEYVCLKYTYGTYTKTNLVTNFGERCCWKVTLSPIDKCLRFGSTFVMYVWHQYSTLFHPCCFYGLPTVYMRMRAVLIHIWVLHLMEWLDAPNVQGPNFQFQNCIKFCDVYEFLTATNYEMFS